VNNIGFGSQAGEGVESLCRWTVAVEMENGHAALHACLGALFFQ
jgi:hypothetical protein